MIRRVGPLSAVAAIGLALLCLGACSRRPAPMHDRYADLINIDVRDVPLLMAADDLESRATRSKKCTCRVRGHDRSARSR